ncbi:MAG: hypothetical protein KC897_11785 [Candidatus Omnitrophica bacterium]|nr:hypothetical protein [Candidatus Omnitrophota bacterium]MCB9720972.1 hypothetical protein [Candidatus Omnitrophota bacterium]
MQRFDYSSGPYVDRVASDLRTQIINLHNILETIERTRRYTDDFILQSLKQTEGDLRRLRKFIES